MKQATLQVKNIQVARNTAFTLEIKALTVQAASVTCVAGPNGSGKSTLLHCLAGLLQTDTGSITIDGLAVSRELRATKAAVGYIPDDEEWFVKELTAREYIALLAEVYADAGVMHDTAAHAVLLANSLYFTAFDQQLQHLSHGNKKKVQLMAGLMHKPRLVIIDELRNGLDPLAIIAAEQLIQREAKRGACIIAATHDLWWAERIADTILLLIDGRVAVEDSARNIVRTHGSVERLFMKTVQKTTP